jgi:periplasmic protein CpxP/Spy
MKKESFYTIIIILLLVLNFGTLSFIWLHRGPGGSPHDGPDHLIFEKLKLDNKQKGQFEILKHEHHSQMLIIQEESSKLHQQLFDLLKKEPVDTSLRNNVIRKLAQNNYQKELVTFQHFQKLRGILNPDQIDNFDDFVQDLSRHLLGPLPPPGRH